MSSELREKVAEAIVQTDNGLSVTGGLKEADAAIKVVADWLREEMEATAIRRRRELPSLTAETDAQIDAVWILTDKMEAK